MHIDWFVLFAQMVNFLILLYLLKRFLYGRIISAIDTRQAKISSTFAEAEQSREEARKASDLQAERLRELERKSEEMLNRARADAEAYRAELMEKARQEIDLLQKRWEETLRSERDSFFQELRTLTAAQVYNITRRVLKDLADMDLEERIVQILAERMEKMEPAEKDKIRAGADGGERIAIHCAFDIPPPAQKKLNEVLEKNLGRQVDVAYEKTDDVISGYELRMNGYKIAWSMKDYMDTLEERFYRVLYQESQAQTQVH